MEPGPQILSTFSCPCHFAAIPSEIILIPLAFGLVIGGMLLSMVVAVILGGFKIGSLERRLSLSVPKPQFDSFWQRFDQRRGELLFRPMDTEGVYRQGDSEMGNELHHFTHSRSKKELRVMRKEGQNEVTIELSLRFLDPVVGDSGETAYRDSVLDYLTGKIDSMRVVPNRNFATLSGLVGGFCTCGAVYMLHSFGFKPLTLPILIEGAATIGMAFTGIKAVRLRPNELTGTWLAIVGIIFCIAGILAAIALDLNRNGIIHL